MTMYQIMCDQELINILINKQLRKSNISFFLGHMYCQQILRQTWHGNVPWQAAPITFKLIHFLLQVMLAPLFACIELTSQVVKENARLFHIKVNFFNRDELT